MTLAIIQARLTSTRLPNKVLRKVLEKPLIGYLLERLKAAKTIDQIVVAIPDTPSNDPLVACVRDFGVDIFRGPEHDVLTRYYEAARAFHAQDIVRITSDCPLMDSRVVNDVVNYYHQGDFDYVSNVAPRSYPDGLDVEIFSMTALSHAYREARQPAEREHVTLFIRNSEDFVKGNVMFRKDFSSERWTLDYEEDFLLIKNIIENVLAKNIHASMQEILFYKERNSKIFKINQKYVQDLNIPKSV